jgi:hypothetical protein
MNRAGFIWLQSLMVFLALALHTEALAQAPYVLIQYLEDQQSRSQGRVHDRNMALEIKLDIAGTSDPDQFTVTGASVELSEGREVLSKTSGSEIYIMRGADARLKNKLSRVKLWRDPLTKKVLAVSLPLVNLRLKWQGPWGAEPDDQMVLGPVSTERDQSGAEENQPALSDTPGLPGWLLKAGVHPDFAVDACPDGDTYLGGGAWLREEPERVWERTYSWELVLRP